MLHTKLDKSPDELRKGLTDAGLPNLFIPAADSFFEIEAMPILGTGKLDLRGIKNLALEKAKAEASQPTSALCACKRRMPVFFCRVPVFCTQNTAA